METYKQWCVRGMRKDVVNRLQEAAKSHKMTLGEMINTACLAWLDNLPDPSGDQPDHSVLQQYDERITELERQVEAIQKAIHLRGKTNASPEQDLPDFDEAAIRKRADELKAEGKSWQEIAEQMNAEGFRTQMGKMWSRRNMSKFAAST